MTSVRCPHCWYPLSYVAQYPLPSFADDELLEGVRGLIRSDALGRVPRWDGTLATARALRPRDAVRVVAHLVRVLDRIHERGHVHRGITAATVAWYGASTWALLDPGSAAPADTEPGCLSPAFLGYAPPEVLAFGEPWSEYADIWSLGCVALDMVLSVPDPRGEGPFACSADWGPMSSGAAERQLRRIFAVTGAPRDIPGLDRLAPLYVTRTAGGRSPSACIRTALRTLLGSASPRLLAAAHARLDALAPFLDAALQVDWRLRSSARRILAEVLPEVRGLPQREVPRCAC